MLGLFYFLHLLISHLAQKIYFWNLKRLSPYLLKNKNKRIPLWGLQQQLSNDMISLPAPIKNRCFRLGHLPSSCLTLYVKLISRVLQSCSNSYQNKGIPSLFRHVCGLNCCTISLRHSRCLSRQESFFACIEPNSAVSKNKLLAISHKAFPPQLFFLHCK